MKLRILFLIGAVALITLSFTFSTNSYLTKNSPKAEKTTTADVHDVGFIADEVVK
jgi:hypothetical protein